MRGIGDCSSVVELFTVVDGEAQRCGCEDKAVLCFALLLLRSVVRNLQERENFSTPDAFLTLKVYRSVACASGLQCHMTINLNINFIKEQYLK